MRVIKPEVASRRKEIILNWLTHRYIVSGKPVSSQEIFDAGIIDISPATIRNILKELDDEGYLEQVHTSGGRIPTDKAYRFYIESILKTQAIAEAEKERIEIEYEKKMAELDYFLKNTTKLLSDLTKKVGFSMVSDIKSEEIKRIDIIGVSLSSYILILVTSTGIVKHYPLILSSRAEKLKVSSIVRLLNKRLKGLTIAEAAEIIKKDYLLRDDSGIFNAIYEIFGAIINEDDEIFIEGISRIYEDDKGVSIEDIRNVSRLLEEKERFSRIIKERFCDALNRVKIIESDKGIKPAKKHLIDVSIGGESNIKDLGNFSIVSSFYSIGDKNCGILGIIGHRRMEYPKIISIIDTVSSIIEEVIEEWQREM
ncbi:MAG: heat-inducible transcriptional repressor HrcA [Elusimicrobiales bacterium]